jgi:RNA recognition motif-containing protein
MATRTPWAWRPNPGEGIFSMAKKLYVGNLSYNTTEDGLRNLFSGFGNVVSAKIIFNRETGESKGFGFIEMGSDEEANAAIAGANGHECDGRQLRVNEAMDKPRRDRFGGGGGGNW